MPPKSKTVFVCTECGYESAKWQGRCPDCGSWNSMQEKVKLIGAASSKPAKGTSGPAKTRALSEISADESLRYPTHMEELDRVLGGGIVPGSAILVCGDPGIGKSTILLQMCRSLDKSLQILYVSGEESLRQIKLRANRLGVEGQNVSISACSDAEQICDSVLAYKPDVVIIDSIQTISIRAITSAAGSVSQVRESTQLLLNACKEQEIPLFLVGHVNKDGGIAGPKVLEHMVDTVLFFEGDRNLSYRILRAIKNRFGSTNEIGVFDMSQNGLIEVPNPSQVLLSGRPRDVSGTCITCLMEGTRPILIEVQALAAKSNFGNPRRVSTGFDYNRTALLIAVLEKRCGYFCGNLDIFINVAGGMRIDEPSADLAVALSLISNLIDEPLSFDLMAVGEIGLAGEVRSATHLSQRIAEGYRLGLRTFVLPKINLKQISASDYPDATFYGISNLAEGVRILFHRG